MARVLSLQEIASNLKELSFNITPSASQPYSSDATMGLTLNAYRRLAETIHQRMQQLHAEGIRGLAVLDRMVTYLPDLQRIWEGASDAQLQQLCDEFPGFYQYAQIMEEAAEAKRQTPSRSYDEFPALTGPLKDSLNALLADAATLERGYQGIKAAAGARPADIGHLDVQYNEWLAERDRFLRDVRSPSAAVPEKVTEFLIECFIGIGEGIERARMGVMH